MSQIVPLDSTMDGKVECDNHDRCQNSTTVENAYFEWYAQRGKETAILCSDCS